MRALFLCADWYQLAYLTQGTTEPNPISLKDSTITNCPVLVLWFNTGQIFVLTSFFLTFFSFCVHTVTAEIAPNFWNLHHIGILWIPGYVLSTSCDRLGQSVVFLTKHPGALEGLVRV